MGTVRTETSGTNEENAWTNLLNESNGKRNGSIPVSVKIDDSNTPKDSGVGGSSTPDIPKLGERKQSLLDTFNRSLRTSLKAVADSPSTLQR